MKTSYSKSRYSKPPFKVCEGGVTLADKKDDNYLKKDPFPCTFCKTPLYTFKGTWYIPMLARLCSEECANMFILSKI